MLSFAFYIHKILFVLHRIASPPLLKSQPLSDQLCTGSLFSAISSQGHSLVHSLLLVLRSSYLLMLFVKIKKKIEIKICRSTFIFSRLQVGLGPAQYWVCATPRFNDAHKRLLGFRIWSRGYSLLFIVVGSVSSKKAMDAWLIWLSVAFTTLAGFLTAVLFRRKQAVSLKTATRTACTEHEEGASATVG